MGLNYEERNAIVMYRLQKAKETLSEAQGTMKMKYWNTAANRFYYACFQAVTALLIYNKYSAHTHSGVSNLFNLHFVATNIFSKEENKLFARLYELRQGGDYSDYTKVDESDLVDLVEPAEQFIKKIEELITNK